jgi:phage terminase small subunit
MSLTPRQRKFVAAYTGNASEAARAAGYSEHTAAEQGYRLLRNVQVRRALLAREQGQVEKLMLTRRERQELWSEIAVDTSQPIMARLRALELLGRSEGDFTDRVELSGSLTLEVLVLGSMRNDGDKTAPFAPQWPAADIARAQQERNAETRPEVEAA